MAPVPYSLNTDFSLVFMCGRLLRHEQKNSADGQLIQQWSAATAPPGAYLPPPTHAKTQGTDASEGNKDADSGDGMRLGSVTWVTSTPYTLA